MNETRAKQVIELAEELKILDLRIKEISVLAGTIIHKKCKVAFDFRVIKEEEEKKAEFDSDGSLTSGAVTSFNVFDSIMRPAYNMVIPTNEEKLSLNIDPDFSMLILQIILDKAKARRQTIIRQFENA